MSSKKKVVKKKAEVRKSKPKAKAPAKKTHSRSSDNDELPFGITRKDIAKSIDRYYQRKSKNAERIVNGSDQQLVLSFPGTITTVSLELNPTLSYSELVAVGLTLKRIKEWTQFAIGDWLNHFEQAHGEMYVQAAAETGLPEETLMIFKYVSSRVAPAVRILKDNVAWSHHREVAKFPPEEQTKWLEKALKKGWSVRDLKAALKKAAGKDSEGQEEGDGQEGPPTGEACECCGSSPAPMRMCSRCAVVPAKALETIGIKGAIELLGRRPSHVQLDMLRWAFEYILEPKFDTDEEAINWGARYDALKNIIEKTSKNKKAA